MKLNFLILICTALLGFALAFMMEGAMPGPQKSNEDATAPLQALPDFSFTDLSGKEYRSSDFKGKTVLLNFWASWCAPCVVEFPILLGLAHKYPDDLILVAVSSDRDEDAINRFLSKQNAGQKTILEQDNVMIVPDYDGRITFNLFNTSRLPETIVVNRAGEMAAKFIGLDWSATDVEKVMRGD